MSILPVLDLMHGRVVRGVGGRRNEYRAIVSKYTQSGGPREVAEALGEHFGFREFYIADLDAIGGAPPAWATFAALQAVGMTLWVDAGVRTPSDARDVAANGVARIIVGLESVATPEALRTICLDLGADRVVFSLDLKDGQPLGNADHWRSADAWGIAQQAVAAGVTHLLVLDLARVGVDRGAGTEELCARLRQTYPALAITAGGGVRGADDVRRLHHCGANRVLVASALHDGRLTADEVEALRR